MSGEVRARMVEITPQVAESLLRRNGHNRSVNESRLLQYAADIRRGDWQVNGEAIKVSDEGLILDGQHRLLAVLEADAPITTLLITGLAADSQETMDQGRARSFGDVLKLRGEREYTNLAAAVRMVCHYERDGVPFAGVGQHGAPATVKQLSRTLERNPEIRESVRFAGSLRRSWISVSAVAALHYLFSIADPDDAEDFIRKVATGENVDARHPAYVLRERLIKEHHDATGLHIRSKLAFYVRAWNAYRRGEVLTRLVWNAGGAHPDRFPQVDGLADAAPAPARPDVPAPGGAGPDPDVTRAAFEAAS